MQKLGYIRKKLQGVQAEILDGRGGGEMSETNRADTAKCYLVLPAYLPSHSETNKTEDEFEAAIPFTGEKDGTKERQKGGRK